MRRRRNPSDSNPYGIDDRVWERIVGSETPTIDKIMFAAALDPLLLVDLDMIQPPRSLAECVQLADMGTRGDLRSYLKSVIIKWVTSDPPIGSHETARNISRWDSRLGVWCAAACAESVLRFVPAGEDRPRLAVEAAKDWVLGLIDKYSAAATAAAADVAAAAVPYNAYSHASRAASSAANAAANAAAYAARAVAYSSYAGSAASSAYNAIVFIAEFPADINAADVFIRDVIARAIESYPVDQS